MPKLVSLQLLASFSIHVDERKLWWCLFSEVAELSSLWKFHSRFFSFLQVKRPENQRTAQSSEIGRDRTTKTFLVLFWAKKKREFASRWLCNICCRRASARRMNEMEIGKERMWGGLLAHVFSTRDSSSVCVFPTPAFAYCVRKSHKNATQRVRMQAQQLQQSEKYTLRMQTTRWVSSARVFNFFSRIIFLSLSLAFVSCLHSFLHNSLTLLLVALIPYYPASSFNSSSVHSIWNKISFLFRLKFASQFSATRERKSSINLKWNTMLRDCNKKESLKNETRDSYHYRIFSLFFMPTRRAAARLNINIRFLLALCSRDRFIIMIYWLIFYTISVSLVRQISTQQHDNTQERRSGREAKQRLGENGNIFYRHAFSFQIICHSLSLFFTMLYRTRSSFRVFYYPSDDVKQLSRTLLSE